MSIKVMIADDHGMMREGIKQLLEYDGNIEIIAEAKDGIECIEIIDQINEKPDVLLLDINMPNMNGIEVLLSLTGKKVGFKIIMLTVHNEAEYLIKAIDIGANGYILKDSESSELKRAIQLVLEGENYIQPQLVPTLNARLLKRDTDKDKIDSLTKRELEVLLQVASGMFNKEIAIILNISERTVKNHISNIFKKIEVVDRTQAAVFAIRNSLILLH